MAVTSYLSPADTQSISRLDLKRKCFHAGEGFPGGVNVSMDIQSYLHQVDSCTEAGNGVPIRAVHETVMANWAHCAHSLNDPMVTAFSRVALAESDFHTLEGVAQRISNLQRKEISGVGTDSLSPAADHFSQQNDFISFSHHPSISSSDEMHEDTAGVEDSSLPPYPSDKPEKSSAIEMTLRRQIQAMEWALEAKSESMLSMKVELENAERGRNVALQRQEAAVRKLAVLTERVGALEGDVASLTAQLWRSQQAEEELAHQLGETEVEGLERVASMGQRWRGDLVVKEGELEELRRANIELQSENVHLREGQFVLDSLSGSSTSDEGRSRDPSTDGGSVHGRRDGATKVWSGMFGWILRQEGVVSTSDYGRFYSREA